MAVNPVLMLAVGCGLNARGFFPTFQEFAMTTFGVFVPMSCLVCRPSATCVGVSAFHRAICDLEGSAKTDVLNLATGKHITNADVFTDGSAVGQGVTGFTVAAASVVHCNGHTNVKQDALPLPGNDHPAHGAEVWGVIMALSRIRFVHIFSDCASVISNLTAAICARRSRFVPK